MSTIKEIKKLVAKNDISKALKAALALTEKHEIDDLENSFIGLQARQTSVEEAEMDGIMNPAAVNMEKAKIRKSVNFFLDKLEDELPEEQEGGEAEENLMSSEEAKQKEIDSLTKSITHLINKITHLRDKASIETNPGTKFDLDVTISELEKELDASRARLDSLG